MKRFILSSVLACGAVLGAGSSARAADLPKAETILDREAEVVGIKAAEKVKSASLKCQLAVKGRKIEMLVQFEPGRYHKTITTPDVGSVELVLVGETAWKNHSITGAELLQGAERAALVREAAKIGDMFRDVGNWRKKYKTVKCVAEEKVGGKTAYKVELTAHDGSKRVCHHDKESGLLIRIQSTEDGPEGKVTETQHFSDYKKVGGVMFPFTTRIVEGDSEMVVTIDRIDVNVKLAEERFVPPAEIKKLVKQK